MTILRDELLMVHDYGSLLGPLLFSLDIRIIYIKKEKNINEDLEVTFFLDFRISKKNDNKKTFIRPNRLPYMAMHGKLTNDTFRKLDQTKHHSILPILTMLEKMIRNINAFFKIKFIYFLTLHDTVLKQPKFF